jgi:hypothetical protein
MMIPKFGIRVAFLVGAIQGMMGRELEHFTTEWTGKMKISIVHTFHETARRFANGLATNSNEE